MPNITNVGRKTGRLTAVQRFGIVTTVLIVAFAVILTALDSNVLKSYVAKQVSIATGRTISINGDLKIHLSLRPHIIMDDVVVGNIQGGSSPDMMTSRHVEFTVDLPKLIVGHLVLPEVKLSEPYIFLETINGRQNWDFGNEESSRHNPPDILSLSIDQGTLHYRSIEQRTDLFLHLQTHGVATNTLSDTTISGEGRFKGMSVAIAAQGGAIISLRNANDLYPLSVHAVIGATKITARGLFLDPLHLQGENIDFQLEGADLADLYPLVGVPLPPTPKYSLSGHLGHTGAVWSFSQFHGVVGSSDIAGDFSVDRATHPQFIHASLTSTNINLEDLGGFIGAKRGIRNSPFPPPAGKLLPRESFDLEKLNVANADVRFVGKHIVTTRMPLDHMEANLSLRGGILELHPLNFGVAGGDLTSVIMMDARQPIIQSKINIKIQNIHLERLFSPSALSVVNIGLIGGRAEFYVDGNSIATMLGGADGRAALIIDGGSISELELKLSNLDLANSLGLMVTGDKQVPLQCMVANFDARNGDFRVDQWVVNTDKAIVMLTGDVNLKAETLNLSLRTHSTSFSLAALRGPITVGGTLAAPTAYPDPTHAIPRAALAIALAIPTAGVGALLPLIQFGENKESNCAQLLNNPQRVSPSP